MICLGEGGFDLIEVIDDGCGMIVVDIVLVLEWYVIFKLFDENIELVVMLGFWGEVLFLIVSVVMLLIESWVCGVGEGWKCVVDYGVVVYEGLVVLLLGICICVEGLFVCVFVWCKFLCSLCSEYVVCFDVVCCLVMVWLEIGFVFEYDGWCMFLV